MSSSSEPAIASTAESDPHSPLLRPRQVGASPQQSTSLAVLLGRVTGHRAPSILVRETAVRALEEWRADWGYSKPVVALDMLWNTALVAASVVVLACTRYERPNTPIREWICVYVLQCLIHVVLVSLEFRQRDTRRRETDLEAGEGIVDFRRADYSEDGEEDGSGRAYGRSSGNSFAKRCESMNTMLAFFWWIIGFYWVVTGGDILMQNAPGLYWLSVVFLAFDVFFALFFVTVACVIGIALCCCLPCIIAILYSVAGTEGASESDLSNLTKYRYQVLNNGGKSSIGAGKMVAIGASNQYLLDERIILDEDAECCICLSSYEVGAELHALPCNHHYHSTCIVTWLKMNATCPLCKFNILEGSNDPP